MTNSTRAFLISGICAALVIPAACGKDDDSGNCAQLREGPFPPDDSGFPPDDSGLPPDDGGDEEGPGSGGMDEGGDEMGNVSGDNCIGMGDDGGDDGPAGSDGPGDEGGDDAPSDEGGDEEGGDEGGSKGGLGDNCTMGDDCEGGKCILSQGDSGFCTRQCVSAEDCPEEGWVCNLSPYTACVPE